MAGRQPYVFSATVLGTGRISEIIKLATEYNAKINNQDIAMRDTLRADALIKTLVAVSGELYKSVSISNKLIDALLSRDEKITEMVNKHLLSISGYKYDDVNNMIYYLTWFACTDIDPVYSTLDEFVENINK